MRVLLVLLAFVALACPQLAHAWGFGSSPPVRVAAMAVPACTESISTSYLVVDPVDADDCSVGTGFPGDDINLCVCNPDHSGGAQWISFASSFGVGLDDVASVNIVDGQILTDDIGNSQVTTVKILDRTILSGDIALGAIGSPELTDGGISLDDLESINAPTAGQCLTVSASNSISYATCGGGGGGGATSEGQLETNLSDVSNVFTNNDGALTDDDLSDNSTSDLAEGTNLYHTNARVDARIGVTAPADHASSHSDGGSDEVSIDDLATSSTDTALVFKPDGSGGVTVGVDQSGGGGYTPNADPGVDHSGFDTEVASSASVVANTAHAGSTANPHAVTAAQAGAEPSGTVSTHAASADHDARYFTEAEQQAGPCNATSEKMIGVGVDGSPICGTDQTGGSGSTNLSVSPAASTVDVNSSSGTNATLPAATTTTAGVLTGADKTKLDGIETGAAADQSAVEVVFDDTGSTIVGATVQAALDYAYGFYYKYFTNAYITSDYTDTAEESRLEQAIDAACAGTEPTVFIDGSFDLSRESAGLLGCNRLNVFGRSTSTVVQIPPGTVGIDFGDFVGIRVHDFSIIGDGAAAAGTVGLRFFDGGEHSIYNMRIALANTGGGELGYGIHLRSTQKVSISNSHFTFAEDHIRGDGTGTPNPNSDPVGNPIGANDTRILNNIMRLSSGRAVNMIDLQAAVTVKDNLFELNNISIQCADGPDGSAFVRGGENYHEPTTAHGDTVAIYRPDVGCGHTLFAERFSGNLTADYITDDVTNVTQKDNFYGASWRSGFQNNGTGCIGIWGATVITGAMEGLDPSDICGYRASGDATRFYGNVNMTNVVDLLIPARADCSNGASGSLCTDTDDDSLWLGGSQFSSGGGAPTTAGYLVTVADGALSNEVAVGATPGGDLGGTWAAPTVDDDSHAHVIGNIDAFTTLDLMGRISDEGGATTFLRADGAWAVPAGSGGWVGTATSNLDMAGFAVTGASSYGTAPPTGSNVYTHVINEGVSDGTDEITISGPVGGFAADRACTIEDSDTPYHACAGAPRSGEFGAAADLDATGAVVVGAISADELDELGVESSIESVLDLPDLQGVLTDGQIPAAIARDSEVAAAYQPLDADLTDLADGSLSGSAVGAGISGSNVTVGTIADVRIAASIARDSELHAAVSLAGTPDYATIAGQVITLGLVDLDADITGTLPGASVGTGIDGGNITAGTVADARVAASVTRDTETTELCERGGIDSPDDSDRIITGLPYAATITRLSCIASGGGTITLALEECNGSGASCVDGGISVTCSATGADDTTFTDAAFDANDDGNLNFGTASGTVDYATWTICHDRQVIQ